MLSDKNQVKQGDFKCNDNAYQNISKAIELFDKNRFLGHIERINLVPGDLCKTLPKFLEENPHIILSLVHLDVDLYRPTKVALENIIGRMSKGGIIIFDELNHPDYPGETQAMVEVLNINNFTIHRSPFSASCSYIII